MAGRLEPVTMYGMRLIFRNFEGKKSKFNEDGKREFGVLLDPQVAEDMLKDGWNVKYLKPREDDDDDTEPQPWLPIEAAFDKGRPPRCVLITDRGRTNLDEDSVQELDWVDIRQDDDGNPMVDLIVRPYTWEVNGRGGVKAYLQSIYVTADEDDLQQKYGHLEQQ